VWVGHFLLIHNQGPLATLHSFSFPLSSSYFGALFLPGAGGSVGCGGVALVYIFSAGCCSPVFFVVSIKNIFPAAKK